jgi:hypothetical protein
MSDFGGDADAMTERRVIAISTAERDEVMGRAARTKRELD